MLTPRRGLAISLILGSETMSQIENSAADRILVYGGIDITGADSFFLQRIVDALASQTDAIFLSGGFICFEDRPEAISVDASVLQGLQGYCARTNTSLASRLELLIPDRSLDRPGVRRTDCVPHSPLLNVSAMLQRFIRVRRADFVITFRGHIHTETVLAAALETPGKLVLPFPASGGDSRTYWTHQKRIVISRLPEVLELMDALEAPLPRLEKDVDELAGRVARAVKCALDRVRIKPEKALTNLLVESFDYDELRRFMRLEVRAPKQDLDANFASRLPETLADLVEKVISFLAHRNLLDREFFQALLRERALKESEIRRVAALHHVVSDQARSPR